MKTANHTKSARDPLLHVEAEGCIVNIRVNLQRDDNREITRIDVQCDQYAGEPQWYIVDEQGNKIQHLGISVQRETEQEFENRRAYERMINKREAKLTLQDALRLYRADGIPLLTFKDKTGEYAVEIVRERGYKNSPDKYRVYTVESRMEFYLDSFNTIKDAIKAVYEHINYWDGTLLEFKLELDYCEKCSGSGEYLCPTCQEWFNLAPSIASDAEQETYMAHFAMDKCEYGRLGCEECNGLGFKQ